MVNIIDRSGAHTGSWFIILMVLLLLHLILVLPFQLGNLVLLVFDIETNVIPIIVLLAKANSLPKIRRLKFPLFGLLHHVNSFLKW